MGGDMGRSSRTSINLAHQAQDLPSLDRVDDVKHSDFCRRPAESRAAADTLGGDDIDFST
jgi:hypothetical protein